VEDENIFALNTSDDREIIIYWTGDKFIPTGEKYPFEIYPQISIFIIKANRSD